MEIESIKTHVSDIQRKLNDFVLRDEFLKLEHEVKNLREDVNINKENIQTNKDEIDKLRRIIDAMHFPSMEEFNMLKGRVDALENQIGNIRKLVSELEKKIKGMGRGNGGGADQGMLDKVIEELNTLRAEFEAHRD